MALRLLLADDHAVVRQSLRTLLESKGFEVAGEADNGRDAIRLAGRLDVRVAIMDIGMPVLNGIDAARELRRRYSEIRTILLTQHDEEPYIAEALRVGVRGYVLKRQLASDLIDAVHEVLRGRVYLSPSISATVADVASGRTTRSSHTLSGRERQVLQLIAEGHSCPEVATALGISTKTAESHRSRIMQKLDIHETATLVRYAIRLGLIQP